MYQLKEYQEKVVEEGFHILKEHHILYLMLEMRLGKTICSLSIAREFGSVLFVTTKSAIKDIANAPSKFGLNIDLTIINYERLSRILKMVEEIKIERKNNNMG